MMTIRLWGCVWTKSVANETRADACISVSSFAEFIILMHADFEAFVASSQSPDANHHALLGNAVGYTIQQS